MTQLQCQVKRHHRGDSRLKHAASVKLQRDSDSVSFESCQHMAVTEIGLQEMQSAISGVVIVACQELSLSEEWHSSATL
eukprot:863725-Amphidinium_carterae.1